MTEDQKYQGSLYKPKRQKSNGTDPFGRPNNMSHNAYVEDVTEYEEYQQYQIHEDDVEDAANLPPEAPTPPPAVADDPNVNVFDFLVDHTPNVSNVNLQYYDNPTVPSGARQLVRFEQENQENQEIDDYVDPTGYMVDEEEAAPYGPTPIEAPKFETPMPKPHRRRSKDGETLKDKKRKRLHIETPGPLAFQAHGDEVMTDAPPVLHSGLTGGLNRLMRPSQFPPSPDYSGGDNGEISPTSPVKKTKHSKSKSKSTRPETVSGGFKAFISGTSKSKVSKKRKHSSDKDKDKKEKKEKKSRHHHRSSSEKVPKLIEFRPKSRDEKDGESGQMILYKPRSDLFLSLCNKGPESERGCSVNKALKKYHRERSESGSSLGKSTEEKELWRSLRMRRNERGEIVLFSIEA